MINLVSPQKKNSLKREQKKRHVVIVLYGLVFLLVMLNVLGWTLWTYFDWPTRAIVSKNLSKNQLNISPAALEQFLKLSSWWPVEPWFQILAKLSERTPSSLETKQFTGTWDIKKNIQQLTWQGNFASRQELVDFSEKLRLSKIFAEVNLPFDNLVKSGKQVEFILNLKLKSK